MSNTRLTRANWTELGRLDPDQFVQGADPAADRVFGRLRGTIDLAAVHPDLLDVLRGMALEMTCGLRDGTVRQCGHVNRVAPRSAFASVWIPAIDCYGCVGLRMSIEAPSETERWTCDICRRYSPCNTDEHYARIGGLILSFGACSACLPP